MLESVCSGIMRGMLMILPTYFMGTALNKLSQGVSPNDVTNNAIPIVLLPVVVLVLYVVDIRLSKYVFEIIGKIRFSAIQKILKSPTQKVDKVQPERLFTDLIKGTQKIEDFYFNTVNSLVWYIATLVMGVFLMLNINIELTVMLVSIVLLQIMFFKIQFKNFGNIAKELQIEEGKGLRLLMNTKKNIVDIRSYQNEDRVSNKLQRWLTSYHKVFRKYTYAYVALLVIEGLGSIGDSAIIYFAGGGLVRENITQVGSLVAMNSYIVWLTPVLSNLYDWITTYFGSRGLKNQVNLVSATSDFNLRSKNPSPRESVKSVEAKRLTYKDRDGVNIKEMSFTLSKSSPFFVKGPSGSGKSTLLKILHGDIAPSSGCVLINNMNMRDIDLSWLHNHVTISEQMPEVFPGTLFENLMIPDETRNNLKDFRSIENRVKDLLMDLGLQQFCKGDFLNNTLDFSKISDGERKRISLARAILHSHDVLLLDEPTAGLDQQNTNKVMRTIRGLAKSMFIVVVTHANVERRGDALIEIGSETGGQTSKKVW